MSTFPEDHPIVATLAGALLLAGGLICLALVVTNLVKDFPIWFLGRRVTAEVVDSWVERTSDDSERELTFQYYVRYRFTVPNAQVITRTSIIGVREWSALEIGGPVAVTYFPLYPAHSRVDQSRFVPVLACAYIPLAIMSWAGLKAGWYVLGSALAPWQG